jgi:hypothetical protein
MFMCNLDNTREMCLEVVKLSGFDGGEKFDKDMKVMKKVHLFAVNCFRF